MVGIRTNRFLADLAADPPTLYRWEIDLTHGVVTERALDRHPVEFPRVDERGNGRPYRHVYTVEYRDVGPAGLPRSSLLHRNDVEAGASVAKDFGDRYVPGETVFVPKSSDAAETDGWVLALRYDRELDRSDLFVLDTNEFGADPVAVVQLPRQVPVGFHGRWVAD